MVNMKALPNRVIILGTARMLRGQQREDEDETATVAEEVVEAVDMAVKVTLVGEHAVE